MSYTCGPRRRTAWRLAATLALGTILATPLARPGIAFAQPDGPPPSASDREAAARAFSQGQRAFKKGDFRHAAESFEAAYKDAPHPSSLWNAARAWHRARELARAANLYAKFLREAPADSRDRNSAQAAMRDLASKIARIDVVAPDVTDLKVDGQPIEGTTAYVNPGAHVVEGQIDGRAVRQAPNVQGGDVVSVALVPPQAQPQVAANPGSSGGSTPPNNPPPPPGQPPDTTHGTETTPSSGWSPIVVVVGGGLTALAGGVTIWSGIDTENARGSFNGTSQQLTDGLGKEHRTNIALGVTIGLAALTTVAAVFLVDWHKGGKSAEVGIGPGTLAVKGTF